MSNRNATVPAINYSSPEQPEEETKMGLLQLSNGLNPDSFLSEVIEESLKIQKQPNKTLSPDYVQKFNQISNNTLGSRLLKKYPEIAQRVTDVNNLESIVRSVSSSDSALTATKVLLWNSWNRFQQSPDKEFFQGKGNDYNRYELSVLNSDLGIDKRIPPNELFGEKSKEKSYNPDLRKLRELWKADQPLKLGDMIYGSNHDFVVKMNDSAEFYLESADASILIGINRYDDSFRFSNSKSKTNIKSFKDLRDIFDEI